MSDLNTCSFTGNLTADPETRYTPKGTAVCDFTLAVNRGFGDSQTTAFIGMTAWGKTAENMAKYLGKGSKVSVRGRLTQERWEKDGQKQSKTKVVVEELNFINSRERRKSPTDVPPQRQPAEPAVDPAAAADDDIPF